MLELARRLDVPGIAYLAPAAHEGSWYPKRFVEPKAANEPWLGHALEALEAAVRAARPGGLEARSTVLVGFSQGACLTAEFVARRPRAYAGVALLTGGLIGTDDELSEPSSPLEGLPIFLGTSRQDDWVPLERVERTATIFRAAGATVAMKVYDDPDHHVNDGEVTAVRELLVERARSLTGG